METFIVKLLGDIEFCGLKIFIMDESTRIPNRDFYQTSLLNLMGEFPSFKSSLTMVLGEQFFKVMSVSFGLDLVNICHLQIDQYMEQFQIKFKIIYISLLKELLKKEFNKNISF